MAIFFVIAFAFEYFLLTVWRFRQWHEITVSRDAMCFPKLCPGCDSTALRVLIRESSISKGVFWQKFLTIDVPYCGTCGDEINSKGKDALKFSVITMIAIVVLLTAENYNGPHAKIEIAALCALLLVPLFGHGKYAKQGLILGRYSKTHIRLHVKRRDYYEAISALNPQAR